MPQFSTHESVSLEKQVNLNSEPVNTKSEDIDRIYEINRCAEWIKDNNFQKVCLQFPDYLLPDSSEVVLKLQPMLNQTLYILGDTAYESCCIDYVAAAHINADAIIHFGAICFSKTSANIPHLNIYEKYDLNIELFKDEICKQFKDKKNNIIVLVDTPYIHLLDEIILAGNNIRDVIVQRIDDNSLDISNKIIIFIGNNDRKLANIEFNFQPKLLYYFYKTLKKFEPDPRVLKRRNFVIEKIKDSSTIGIIIGTLGVKNYLKVIERLKKLISLSGKKYYLISVGKPTVAKLANFPEIDIYVIITCSLSEIYDSREFYKPLATPFDIEVALNKNHESNIKFSYDYNRYLGENLDLQNLEVNENEGDVSLLSNKIRSIKSDTLENINLGENQVALKNAGTVAVNSNYGAGFLADRSWKGLEQNLGQTEAKLAEEGRKGIAQKYTNEEM